MAGLELVDENGEVIELACSFGDTIFQSLLRNHIPPESVIVIEDNEPISTLKTVEAGKTYRAYLMERYNVIAQTERYESHKLNNMATVSRQLSLGDNVRIDQRELSLDELSETVEKRLVEVVDRYEMFEKDETVAVAYSGGIDSSALLLALTAVADDLPNINLRTMTIADYWTGQENTPNRDILEELDVHNDVISTKRLVEIYGLNRPPNEVLTAIQERQKSVDVLSVANSFNRRLFEEYAQKNDIQTVCIGNHASDFIAGFFSGIFGGTSRSPDRIPVRQFGSVRYVYPLAFYTKQQLALYRYACTGQMIRNTGFDPWQMNTGYRHFYYYLADIIQSYCPGFIHWLASDLSNEDRHQQDFEFCRNCNKAKSPTDLDKNGYCIVCRILSSMDFIS